MHKDTLRLILFLECNMRCTYCCNDNEKFSSMFLKARFNEINFDKYENICITGGEPFLYKKLLYWVLNNIPTRQSIYLYTNGLRISNGDIGKLQRYPNIKCINVGLHTSKQLNGVNKNLELHLPVRFMAQESKLESFIKLYPERLNRENVKSWRLNECNLLNEDWILLEDIVLDLLKY